MFANWMLHPSDGVGPPSFVRFYVAVYINARCSPFLHGSFWGVKSRFRGVMTSLVFMRDDKVDYPWLIKKKKKKKKKKNGLVRR